ncbi:MAG: hypothetical protein J5855_05625 [Mailhella sp.]|nr:hypothetical protein [Mailhella sp.]
MKKGEAIIRDSGDSLYVSYEDFDVEFFGGSDYEVTYTINGSDRQKLWEALKEEGLEGTLEQMILAHFGEYLDKNSFEDYCEKRNIKFDLSTWLNCCKG